MSARDHITEAGEQFRAGWTDTSRYISGVLSSWLLGRSRSEDASPTSGRWVAASPDRDGEGRAR